MQNVLVKLMAVSPLVDTDARKAFTLVPVPDDWTIEFVRLEDATGCSLVLRAPIVTSGTPVRFYQFKATAYVLSQGKVISTFEGSVENMQLAEAWLDENTDNTERFRTATFFPASHLPTYNNQENIFKTFHRHYLLATCGNYADNPQIDDFLLIVAKLVCHQPDLAIPLNDYVKLSSPLELPGAVCGQLENDLKMLTPSYELQILHTTEDQVDAIRLIPTEIQIFEDSGIIDRLDWLRPHCKGLEKNAIQLLQKGLARGVSVIWFEKPIQFSQRIRTILVRPDTRFTLVVHATGVVGIKIAKAVEK